MRELLLQKTTGNISREEKNHRVREYLQIWILKILFDREYFNTLAFVGGTALRVLYGLKRYSEDLDFNLTNKKGWSFAGMLKTIARELERGGLAVEITFKTDKNVNSGFVKFPGLLKELGLSDLAGQKLSIKLEVDANPPKGWKTAISPVSAAYVFAVKHYDLPSLYAGKLHACFYRPYTKGRDFYDLVWYLGKKIEPIFTLLNNSFRQTEKKNMHLDANNLRAFMRGQFEKVDFAKARKDVERFLEDKSETRLFDKKILLSMLEHR